MKINTIIPFLLILNIFLGGLAIKYYFENGTMLRRFSVEEEVRKGTQILTLDEIKEHFSKKMSIPVGDIIVEVFDFKNNIFFGSISMSLNLGKPGSEKIGNFYVSKKNGTIFSEETNGEFECKSLAAKGFDVETVNLMGGCYISK